jgi:DNA-directed RNA polymerase specialized sigma24 family protein
MGAIFAMPTKEVVDYQLTAFDLSATERRRAVIAVASVATDASECVELLDMLGLSASEAAPQVPMPRG